MRTAGILFFLAGLVLILGIMTAEIFYPNYNVSRNMVSDLGVNPFSGGIFAFVMIASGILVLGGSWLLRKVNKIPAIILALSGIGAIGVGLFPEFRIHLHVTFALLAFSMAGLGAIFSAKVTKPPFSVLSIVLGFTTLGFLFANLLLPDLFVPILGRGGAERWVLYPAIIWMIGFGGYLMNSKK